MADTEVRLKDLPGDLLSSIVETLKRYTVGLYRRTQQLGTGTLVQCGKRWGLLTAHHVVHRPTPPLDISPSSSENLLLAIMESRHSLEIPASYLKEIEIGVPVSDATGPDMTFLELPLGNALDTLRAVKSFWNLDHATDERLALAMEDSGVWVKIGLPNEWETAQMESEDTLRIDAQMVGFFGFSTSDRRYESGEFDYANTEAHYGGMNSLPSSFGGLSGGGLWKVRILRDHSRDTWDFEDPIFCGVPFYEGAIVDGKRIIRCHYARSIYQKARALIAGFNEVRA